jgi:hypothetical protein
MGYIVVGNFKKVIFSLLEYEDIILCQNVVIWLPIDAASYPRSK